MICLHDAVTRLGNDLKIKIVCLVAAKQWCMNAGRAIFAQLVENLPHKEFQKCVGRYRGDSNLRGNIPTFIRITDGKVADVNVLDELLPEAGAYYVMDRGYIDFERLYHFTLESAFFVVRAKTNVLFERRYSHPVDHATGVRSDQTVILTSMASASAYRTRFAKSASWMLRPARDWCF